MRFYEFKIDLVEASSMSVKIVDNKTIPGGNAGSTFIDFLLNNPQEIRKTVNKKPTGEEFTEITESNLKELILQWQQDNPQQDLASNPQEFIKILEQGLGPNFTTLLNAIEKTEAFGSTKKEKYKVKPSHVFTDVGAEDIAELEATVSQQAIPGTNLEGVILNSPALDPTRNVLGEPIKAIVTNLQNGSTVAPAGKWWKMDNGQAKKAVRDYAGEYLGIVALVNDLAVIPSLEQLQKFLGVNSLRELSYYFPKKANTPLADSFGWMKSNTQLINISSKGGTSGAAPSISNLTISDSLKSTKNYQEEVEFINLVKEASEFTGAFKMYNLLHRVSKDSMDTVGGKTSFSDSEIRALVDINKERDTMNASDQLKAIKGIEQGAVGKYYDELVKRFPPKSKGGKPTVIVKPIGFLRFYTQRVSIDAVNKKQALPQFQKVVREVMGDNFMQVYTDFPRPGGDETKDGKIVVKVMYPASILEEIKVEVKSGSSTTHEGGRLGFKMIPSK